MKVAAAAPVVRQPAARAASDMERAIPLLVMLSCAAAGAPGALRRNTYYGYTSDSSGEEYEPYAVAALPLHAPVPVLQVLGPASGRRPARRPARRPRPDADAYALATSHGEQYEPVRYDPVRYEPARYRPVRYEPVRYEPAAYEPAGYESVGYERVYAEPEPQPKRTEARDQREEEASSVLVYARPNQHGGFTYRRPAAPPPAPRLREPHEPVIIRIQKYRVVH